MDQFICPNCGAALPASAIHAEVVTCQYCNVTFRIPRTLTPEPDMGNLILGADFRQQPVLGWNFPNPDNVQCLNSTPPELRFKFPAKRGVWYALNTSGFFDNLDASVSIRFYEGDVNLIDAGLALRYRKALGSYCVFITPLGSYIIGAYEKGADDSLEWKSILNWTKHSALRPGLNQTNRLRVIVNGDRLRVYLNGVLATSLRDTRYTEGEVLLAGEGTENSAFDIGYSELQLREARE